MKTGIEFKGGDLVRVLRKQNGTSFAWIGEMDYALNQICRVVFDRKLSQDKKGIAVEFYTPGGLRSYFFHMESLQKVEPFIIGDMVKILRKSNHLDIGWQNEWVVDMDSTIGEIGTIVECHYNDKGGPLIEFNKDGISNSYQYPIEVLEFVRRKNVQDSKIGEYLKVIKEDSDWVGWSKIMENSVNQTCKIMEIDHEGELFLLAFNYENRKKRYWFRGETLELSTLEEFEKSYLKIKCIAELYKWMYEGNAFEEGKSYAILNEDDNNYYIEDEKKKPFVFGKINGTSEYYIGHFFEIQSIIE